jgi:hypothetical protein
MVRNVLIILFFTSVIINSIGAQPCIDRLPDEWDFKKGDNFSKYEADIVDCIEWLSNSPLDTNILSRRKAMKFIFDWGKENPALLIFPYSKVSNCIFQDLKDKNKNQRYGVELFMSYYCGMIKYLIEHKISDLRDVQLSGINNVIRLYKTNPEILYDSKAATEFVALQNSDKLKYWIDKKLTRKEIKTHNCFQHSDCHSKKPYHSNYPEYEHINLNL